MPWCRACRRRRCHPQSSPSRARPPLLGRLCPCRRRLRWTSATPASLVALQNSSRLDREDRHSHHPTRPRRICFPRSRQAADPADRRFQTQLRRASQPSATLVQTLRRRPRPWLRWARLRWARQTRWTRRAPSSPDAPAPRRPPTLRRPQPRPRPRLRSRARASRPRRSSSSRRRAPLPTSGRRTSEVSRTCGGGATRRWRRAAARRRRPSLRRTCACCAS